MKRDSGAQSIALFVDFENLVTRTGLSAEAFDVGPMLDGLLERGKVLFRRAYCDWSRFQPATRNLHEHGVELIDVPPSTRAGKNGADVRLVIDALELAYLRGHIDTFVIASGDSDFCPLAYKLREIGRTVLGMGVKEATSPLFVKACDEYVYLKPGGRRRGGARDAPAARDAKEKAPEAREKASESRIAPVIPEVARDAVASILARATGPVNPSAIKEAIVRREPDFDEREHGFSTFKKLLDHMEKEHLLKREQGAKGQWYVVAP
ncbi:MAG TPA: NYN domain-containing protein [Anaeromyxobacteraceae bacterium]|nr:NYN domain-containing protein [Anaeromyxobacteraceae bacterium]